MNEIETDLPNETQTVESSEDGMSYKVGKQTYYTTKAEALSVRRKGDRIYYDAYEKAFYIRRPKRRSFWGFLRD